MRFLDFVWRRPTSMVEPSSYRDSSLVEKWPRASSSEEFFSPIRRRCRPWNILFLRQNEPGFKILVNFLEKMPSSVSYIEVKCVWDLAGRVTARASICW
jgi:hypothetical protein